MGLDAVMLNVGSMPGMAGMAISSLGTVHVYGLRNPSDQWEFLDFGLILDTSDRFVVYLLGQVDMSSLKSSIQCEIPTLLSLGWLFLVAEAIVISGEHS